MSAKLLALARATHSPTADELQVVCVLVCDIQGWQDSRGLREAQEPLPPSPGDVTNAKGSCRVE